MAQILTAPAGFEPPEIDYRSDWQKQESDYLERLARLARDSAGANPHPLIGEIYRSPRGDGYAQYMVWRARPLQLVWIELGDAWEISAPEARGLRLSDIKQQVEWNQNWKKLISKKRGAR